MNKPLKTHIIALFLALLTAFFAVGCKGGGDENADQKPPIVVPELPDDAPQLPSEDEEEALPEQDIPTQKPEQLPEVEQKPENEPEIEQNQRKSVLIRTLVGLNVRTSPEISSNNIVGVTDAGDCFSYEGEEGDFYLTTYKGKRAYISNNVRYSALITFDVASDLIESSIETAEELLGFPYVYGAQRLHYGGADPKANPSFRYGEFDCSSLVQYAFMKGAGISLQVTTRLQFADGIGERISHSKIVRGDLLYFTNESRKNKTGIERIGHVAIYLGIGYGEDGRAIGDYILHTASDHAVIEPYYKWRKDFFEGAIRLA